MDSVSMPYFNMYANWSIHFSITNPNKKMSINYETGHISVFQQTQFIFQYLYIKKLLFRW